MAEPVSFFQTVYPILEKANCRTCHTLDGVASPTRLHFPDEHASQADIERFGHSLVALVDRASPQESPLLVKPTNRIKHSGGQRIAPGSSEEKTLADWISRLARMPKEEVARVLGQAHDAPAPARRQPAESLRRLTHSQYNRTVRDLLGDTSLPAAAFPPEDYINGFKNQYQAQSISPLLAEAYGAAAEKLAASAVRRLGGRLLSCKPNSTHDAACADRFIREFGGRAFRRPLDPAEMSRYRKLFASEAAGQNDFLAGTRAVMEAMLQSPSFLFRLHTTARSDWQPYAAASRLSYFLWDTMPDEPLLEAAARGNLSTPEGIERTARGMLRDPRAREAVDEFASQWLRFDRVTSLLKDRRQFPTFTRETALSMTEETRRLVNHLVWDNRNFMDLFTAGYTFANGDLAALYNVPAPPAEFDRVEFDPAQERSGILTTAAFLALTAKPAETSPTSRGLFIREQFLCQLVPQPPPGVNTNLAPVSAEKPLTNRERLAEHLNNEACASCHNLIDPIGFGFEKFDAVGQRQETARIYIQPSRKERNAKPRTFELPLDTSGWVAGLKDSAFSAPPRLGRILADSDTCRECVVKQLFRYAAGRMEAAADRPAILEHLRRFRNAGFHFQELMVSIAAWSE
jgi:hypothetical protein